MASLEVHVVGEEPFVHVLAGKRTKIGRSISCDIVIPDVGMSRYHAEVSSRGGRYVIEDLGSRHGVLVNGEPIGNCRVLAHDE